MTIIGHSNHSSQFGGSFGFKPNQCDTDRFSSWSVVRRNRHRADDWPVWLEGNTAPQKRTNGFNCGLAISSLSGIEVETGREPDVTGMYTSGNTNELNGLRTGQPWSGAAFVGSGQDAVGADSTPTLELLSPPLLHLRRRAFGRTGGQPGRRFLPCGALACLVLS